MGLWLITLHSEFCPQTPSQGFLHFFLIQACCCEHSELTTHSGLHDGGVPMKSCWQVHTACSLLILHILLGPHREGVQGFFVTEGVSVSRKHCFNNLYLNGVRFIKYEKSINTNLRFAHSSFGMDFQLIPANTHILVNDLWHYISRWGHKRCYMDFYICFEYMLDWLHSQN